MMGPQRNSRHHKKTTPIPTMSYHCRQIKIAKEKHFREQMTAPNNAKKPPPHIAESKKCGFGF